MVDLGPDEGDESPPGGAVRAAPRDQGSARSPASPVGERGRVDEHPSEQPPRRSSSVPRDDGLRSLLERVVPELVKRVVDAGYGTLNESNLIQHLGELKLPRETLNLLLSQLDETRQGLYRVVAREVRDALVKSSLADELTKLLTRLTFEIKTEVRFVPSDALPRPEVRTRSRVRRTDEETSSESGDAAETNDEDEK